MLKTHLVLALLWILFGVLHSVLAGLGVKNRFANAFPQWARHYRLLYTVFAFFSLGLTVGYQLTLASPFVFRPRLFSTVVGAIVGGGGLLLMAVCIKKYFLSLSGLKSLFEQRPAHRLMITGIHRFVRHPLYLGTFAAIWGAFLVYPLLSLLLSNFFITAYTLIGIGFEEKKLLAEFGTGYKTYQQAVPKLIPALRRKPV